VKSVPNSATAYVFTNTLWLSRYLPALAAHKRIGRWFLSLHDIIQFFHRPPQLISLCKVETLTIIERWLYCDQSRVATTITNWAGYHNLNCYSSQARFDGCCFIKLVVGSLGFCPVQVVSLLRGITQFWFDNYST